MVLGPIPEFYHELCETNPLKCPKGVANRLAGLDWVYNHAKNIGDMSGAIYFADDDNTYDIRLFEEVQPFLYVQIFLIQKYALFEDLLYVLWNEIFRPIRCISYVL